MFQSSNADICNFEICKHEERGKSSEHDSEVPSPTFYKVRTRSTAYVDRQEGKLVKQCSRGIDVDSVI
jgi:hypothetical protein